MCCAVVSETDHVLEWGCSCAGDKLVLGYLEHVKSVVELHPLAFTAGGGNTSLGSVSLPSLGSVHSCKAERKFSTLYFSFTSFLYPGRPTDSSSAMSVAYQRVLLLRP